MGHIDYQYNVEPDIISLITRPGLSNNYDYITVWILLLGQILLRLSHDSAYHKISLTSRKGIRDFFQPVIYLRGDRPLVRTGAYRQVRVLILLITNL